MTRYAEGRDHPCMTDTAEANRRLIRSAFQGWQAGTASIADLFAPDMVWRIEGHSEACGEYTSAQDFIEQVLAPFGARFSQGERFRPVNIRSVLADGDTVVVIWDGRGICNDKVPYENSYAWILRLRDGKVIDGTAFFDSMSFNALWQRVTPPQAR
jgi:ketosteroid isomerase-like protein